MTLSRGLDLLKTLAQDEGEGLRVGEICERRGLHRVTAHRILAGLVREGWVEQDENRRYHLGVEAWRIGLSANKRFDLAKLADPSLDLIEQDTQDTTFLLRRTGNEAVCVARRDGKYLLKFLVMDVGVSYPLGVGAATLAILAHLGEQECDAALRETGKALERFPRMSLNQVRTMMEETRKRGFALSTGFIVPGATAVAVPIFDSAARPIGSFACVASPQRLEDEHLALVVATLRREAERVSVRLGASPAMFASRPPPRRSSAADKPARLLRPTHHETQ